MTNREAAIKIIRRLHQNDFEALLAGGCVRDMLLKRRAQDYDIATNAQPKDVIRLFRRTIKVGAKFGVVIVLLENRQVEVATFRTEAGYTDGRHPTSVKFSSPEEDASRRDFTINGMFYDPLNKRILDYVGGQRDLKKRVIRTIGIPDERFTEDYLRMFRAVRFSTQLGFAIEPSTWSAVYSNAKEIVKISGERMAIELEGILTHPNRDKGASLFVNSGLAEVIFTDYSTEQAEFGIAVLRRLQKRPDFALSLACFFAGCEIEYAMEKCRILKLSRNQFKHIKFLLGNRGRLLDECMSLADLKKILAEPYFEDLFEFQKAIQKADIGGRKSIYDLIKLRRRITSLGKIELKPKPLLNGHDLIRLGAVSGPRLGFLLQELYTAQLEGLLQTRKQAIRWIKKWLHKHNLKEI
ncbi:CCA tRNA nucleotidyltransferase [Planctomycetota bacterium]